MVDVTEVEVVDGRTVRLHSSDGVEAVVDLTPFLWGAVSRGIATDDAIFR
jgi:hypothetical protein